MNDKENDKTPLFGSWTGWYIAVIAFLVVEILFFFLFTNYFS